MRDCRLNIEHPTPNIERRMEGERMVHCSVPEVTLVHFQPPASVVSPPLGCLCLLAALAESGITAALRDYQLHEHGSRLDIHDMLRFVLEDSGQVIGFSCMVHMLPHLVLLLREIRRQAPEKKIVLGGPGPSSVAAPLLRRYAVADAVLLGEGERRFPLLVRALRAGTDLSAIPGLVVSHGDGVVTTTGRIERILCLDELPVPAYDMIDLSPYNGPIPLELTRGCPFSCSFCETNLFWGREVHSFSTPRVTSIVEEVTTC